MTEPVEAALIGAGGRGTFAYGSYALKNPHEVRFIAVAEPDPAKRARFASLHGIPAEMQFESWTDLLDRPRLCEALLICTQDAEHYEPAMKAMRTGYSILLEKPMSPDPLETLRMARQSEKMNRILTVCHVSRYSPFFNTVKQLLDRQAIGRIVTVNWTEHVGYWHQAHSFVRGNWGNSGKSSPMLLQKCCHDMDLLQWFIGGQCVQVSSFGQLSFFTEANAPEGSTERCTDGCKVEHQCSFSAIRMYANEIDEWPQNVVTLEPKLELRMKALREGPYGRCVFRCDNDVVDHQVVNLRFDNGVTVAFTMSGLTYENTRTFQIMGTAGEIRGHSERNEIEILHFSGKRELIVPETAEGGHGGADTLTMRDFVRQVSRGDAHGVKSSAAVSAQSHLLVFAAEHSRTTGQTVDMKRFTENLLALEGDDGHA